MSQITEVFKKAKIQCELYDKLTRGYLPNNPGVKYIVYKKKTILYVGESRICGKCNNRSCSAIHAEEAAIRRCIKDKINFEKIKIIIWKENCTDVKSAFSCNWCKNYIKLVGFPVNNIITPVFENGIFTRLTSAVLPDVDNPVVMNHNLKKKNSNN